MTIAHHLILKARKGCVIAPQIADRRRLARAVVRVADPFGLVVFNCPDTHLHLVLLASRQTAGEVARRLSISSFRNGVRIEPAWIGPVEGARHLAHLVHYVSGNAERHGAKVDALHEASNVPDLLGLRLLGSQALARLQAQLPRWSPEELVPVLGVERLAPGTDRSLLAESAASVAVVERLAGRAPGEVRARTAALHVGQRLGAGTRELSALLGLGQRAVQVCLRRPAEPAALRAIELQLGVRERHARRPAPGPGPLALFPGAATISS